MAARDFSVVPKVVLYYVDVVTDWINGVSLLTSGHRSSTEFNTTYSTPIHKDDLQIENSSLVFNTTIDCLTPDYDVCSEDNEFHLWWGSLSIALSWVPAILGIGILIYRMDSEGTACFWILMPIRFILWPLLVPLQMIITACLPGIDAKWILGAKFNAKDSLVFKSVEGTTEAGPQLVLQLYIIARKGLCLSKTGGIIQLVSMVFSTVSIHLASVELTLRDASTWEKLGASLKTAPIFLPFVIFEAGASAVIFAELKYGGLVHFTVWIILATVGVHILRKDMQWREKIMRALPIWPSMATNTSPFAFNLKVTRMLVWLTFCINTLTLILSYLLSQFATGVTFHNETNCWLRENLHIIVSSLIGLGLASCALFELCARFKLHWLSGDDDDRRMPTRNDRPNETELESLNRAN